MRPKQSWTLIIITAMAVLTTLLFVRGGQADLDPPGPPVVTDWVEITKVAITQDFDDGDAELCVQIHFRHPGHKVDDGTGPEWLRFDCWEDVETEEQTSEFYNQHADRLFCTGS